jgi:hypothetical protein
MNFEDEYEQMSVTASKRSEPSDDDECVHPSQGTDDCCLASIDVRTDLRTIVTLNDSHSCVVGSQKQQKVAAMNDNKMMRDAFDRVLAELDIGSRTEHCLRKGNQIDSMTKLLLARCRLAFNQLHFIDDYHQLQLYFVTEWVGEFDIGNGMMHFKQTSFHNYFNRKLLHLAQNKIRITPSYQFGERVLPCVVRMALISALTSKNLANALHDGDVDGDESI